MLMSRVLQNNHPTHGLKDLAWELAGIPKDDEDAIKPWMKGGKDKHNNLQSAPEPLLNKYQLRDAERGMLMFLFLWPKIQANPAFRQVYEMERDVVVPTLAMEDRGVMIDVERTDRLINKLEAWSATVLMKIEKIVGDRIVPGTKAFNDYIFKTLKLPITKRSAKTSNPTFDKEVKRELWEKFKLPIIDLAMQYSAWTHGISTLKGYLRRRDEDDILHPIINTCQAITGRESCEDPNLQNVEKTGVLLNPYPVPARTVFRPRPGYVHFHLDYSGQEARLLIHYSGDYKLLEICNNGDGDTHTYVANLFYGKRFSEGSPEDKKRLRTATKNGFFAIAYGAQFHRVAETLGLSNQEGQLAKRNLEQACPKLVAMMPRMMKEVKARGYIVDAFGTHCYVPRDEAYMSVNYLIQRSAALMLKFGQVRVHDYLEKSTSGEIRLLLPIHDELIIECPRTRLKDAKEVLRYVAFLMTDFPGRFKVPMKVSVDIATVDWNTKHPYLLENA